MIWTMIDFINKARERGVELKQAVIGSGTQRFRAIILTSITTAAGLMPIMMEGSLQAQTVITLCLIPSLYMLQIDAFARMRQFKGWLLKPSYSG